MNTSNKRQVLTIIAGLVNLSCAMVLYGGTVTSTPQPVDASQDVVVAPNGNVTFTASSNQGTVTLDQAFSSFNNGTPSYSGSGSTALVDVTFTDAATGNDNACVVVVNHTILSLSGGGSQQCANEQPISFNVVVPKLTVSNVDVYNDQVTIDVDPQDTPESDTNSISFEGDSELTFWSDDDGPIEGGDNQDFPIDWTQFPQTPGATYTSSSLKMVNVWGSATVTTTYNEQCAFTTYGVFIITKYVTPDDDIWTGPTQNVAFKSDGTGTLRSVHTGWITRVTGQEGRGLSQNTIYAIFATTAGSPVAYYLIPETEGKWVARLTPNKSLATQQPTNGSPDPRFNPLDAIHLVTDPGTHFEIDDTGNWSGSANHFDRFAGVVGPTDPNSSFPNSFVVDVYQGD